MNAMLNASRKFDELLLSKKGKYAGLVLALAAALAVIAASVIEWTAGATSEPESTGVYMQMATNVSAPLVLIAFARVMLSLVSSLADRERTGFLTKIPFIGAPISDSNTSMQTVLTEMVIAAGVLLVVYSGTALAVTCMAAFGA